MVDINYSFAYVKMLLVLAGIVAFLLFIKKLVEKKLPQAKSGIKILSQQMIDSKNRLSLIKYKDKEYLLVTGESGFLIDSYESFDKSLKEEIEDTDDY